MAKKKKIVHVRIVVRLTLDEEQALSSLAETMERDPSWLLGKLAHLSVGATDLARDVRAWLRGDTAWDAGLSGDQIALCVVASEDTAIKRASRRKTVAQDPPAPGDVASYVAAQGYHFDPEEFHAFYTANGWVQGRAGKPLLDWRAACRTWEASWLAKNPSARVVDDWGKDRPEEPEAESEPLFDEELP